MSVRLSPSSSKNSALTGRNFMKFDTSVFPENLTRKFKFRSNLIRIMNILREDQYIRKATNNASLLFHGASWQGSGHIVRAIAQAYTARSSRPLYDILLRSHFVSWNYIFRCAYRFMHFRIKILLFNDIPLYFWSHVAKFFLEWEIFQKKKFIGKMKTHISCPVTLVFFENHYDYEIRYKNIE